jgi:hypothetical protein
MSFIHHFIHLYFFTEFEILFYFYYILPYEKQLVYNMFSRDKILDSLEYNDDIIGLIDNMKTYDYNYNNQCSLERDRIDANHHKLWTYCFIYIIIMNILLFLLFVKDFVTCYREFLPFSKSIGSISSIGSIGSIGSKSLSTLSALSSPSFHNQTKYKKTDFDFEMVDLESLSTSTNKKNNDDELTSASIIVSKNVSFGLYYWNKSEFLLASCKTVQFIILIGIFEYVFFSIIVNKYKVVSAKLLLCKLLQS